MSIEGNKQAVTRFCSGFGKADIDGVLDVELPFSIKPNVTDVPVIMGRTPTNTYRYEGMIDEVAIFNKALTEDDINGIMASGLKNATAVYAKDKLAATWGEIKR